MLPLMVNFYHPHSGVVILFSCICLYIDCVLLCTSYDNCEIIGWWHAVVVSIIGLINFGLTNELINVESGY